MPSISALMVAHLHISVVSQQGHKGINHKRGTRTFQKLLGQDAGGCSTPGNRLRMAAKKSSAVVGAVRSRPPSDWKMSSNHTVKLIGAVPIPST